MWFRSDLRVSDNAALHHACRAATDGVIGIFAFCPRQWADHDWGMMKADFVLRNVTALSQSLARLNIPLLIVHAGRFSSVPRELLRIAARHQCAALYFNIEYETNEVQRDQAVRAQFEQGGRRVHAFCDQVIMDVAGMRTATGGWYTVFTPFRRRWCEAVKGGRSLPVYPRPRRQPNLNITADSVPARLRAFPRCSRPELWPEGEKAAQGRLESFVRDRIRGYDRTRDLPCLDGTSTLSPYLAAGVLSPRQCLQAALKVNNSRLDYGNKGVTTWITELVWREFYRHILIGYPRVCMGKPFRKQTDRLPWRSDEPLFQAWCDGRTGFPIIDAGMRQLAQTGWMHNRVRMLAAMFLTKDLLIDWRWGERYFMRHLVDGDYANNNGGWQWSASTGTDAAPYFRVFNPLSQSRRCDPDGDYIRRFVPELKLLSRQDIHEPRRSGRSNKDYPIPIVEHESARRTAIAMFRALSRRAPA